MNPTSHDEEEIFCQAVDIKDSTQREDFLRRACHTKPALRDAIDAMLADHDQATKLFQNIASNITLKNCPSEDSPEFGQDYDLKTPIGPYQLVQRLGEGGGGVVYEARQQTPVHRQVAIKILKPGLDQARVLNRFEAERQALELMEHPNIARVLDAGVTHDGRPYFVMELVKGVRITEHCEKNALSLSARLQLLQQVCFAVQHAHQKGVIHCDIKPSNILVSLVEGAPVLKVIDFGIAKATAGAPSEWTGQGFPAGTPAYMSPEQIGGSRDIDTRSDVYSLGVVLYELLAGKTPLDQDDTTTRDVDIRQRLISVEPPPPSQAAGQSPSTLRLQWNEDLDWIVMKAIAKDRELRYATMRGFGQDIARYLANEPVAARPPSRFYRFRKLVERNRLASFAIAAGVLALVFGFTASSLLYLKAQAAEREQAQLYQKAQAAEREQAKLRAQAEEREYVAKAAIFLLQNKHAEADAEIQRMGGMLTQPSVEATNVFRSLATWNALRGDWKAVSQRLLALSRVNRFDESDLTDNASRDLVGIAPALIEAGDINDYRQFEVWILDTMGSTKNPTAAEQILKICLHLPPSQELRNRLDSLATVAEKSLPNLNVVPINRIQAWRCFALGLWKYRTGKYEESIRFLNSAANANASKNEATIYYCSLSVRSLSWKKLGQTEKSDADLKEAQAMVNEKFAKPMEFDSQGYWNDWLTARILLREAANEKNPSE